MKHTALPWQLHPVYPGLKIVANYQETEGSATYSEICNVNPNTDLENGNAKDNADLILNACNCHEELIEACQEAESVIALKLEGVDFLTLDRTLNVIKQALANATK